LAWKGSDSQPKTIERGVFVLRRVLCQPLGNPPASALAASFGGQPTNRERIAALTGSGTCGAACHGTFINPAGFAFEHFGALGEFRTEDAGQPIDSSGTFPFADGDIAYRNAAEFSRALADNLQAHACFGSFLLEYLLGRRPTSSESGLLATLARRSLSGVGARELVAALLESEALTNRATSWEQP
jgi:hypothetical protein